MPRRNLDAAPEPGKNYKGERDHIVGRRFGKPKARDYKDTPTNRKTYKPTNE